MPLSKIKPFIFAIAVMQLTACASMFNGSEQEINIKTHPNAEIYIDDRFAGNGQTRKKLARDQAHIIRVEMGECQQTYTTKAQFNKTSLLGVFVDLGLISIPIDFMTGAAWDIHPDRFIMQPECMLNK